MKYNLKKGNGVKVEFVSLDSEVKSNELNDLIKREKFSKKLGSAVYLPNENVIYLGIGNEKDLVIDDMKVLGNTLGNKLRSEKLSEVEVEAVKFNALCSKKIAQYFVEGLINSEYVFDKYLTDKKTYDEIVLNYLPHEGKEESTKAGIEEGITIMEGIYFTRDVVNEPANVMYPEVLAKRAKELLEPYGVKVEVYGRKECEEMGMHAFLSVAKGSLKEPQLIVMRYLNSEEKDVTALVGKSIMYDTGGYSLKPSNSMDTMFCDMGGAATVMGAIYTLAKENKKVNVIGVAAACENMISGESYRPGDIVGSMKGKTIEVANTDAEGRVTLADSIYYATSQENVTRVIDLATLTGACLVALGEGYTGMLTNNKEFASKLVEVANEVNEKVWELPNDDYFREMNKSKVADIKNTGGRYGGTITAGQFVSEFINGDKEWIHLDIAGTAFLSKTRSYLPLGATGVHVKTLYTLLKDGK